MAGSCLFSGQGGSHATSIRRGHKGAIRGHSHTVRGYKGVVLKAFEGLLADPEGPLKGLGVLVMSASDIACLVTFPYLLFGPKAREGPGQGAL